jgi:lysophospholipase L1-like esterase
VFLGDSYTSGFNGSGIGARGWPHIIAAARGWTATNLAVPGTGFLNPGWTGQPVWTLLGRAIDRHPDIVVVAAGHNDFRYAASATATAADRVIRRIHRSLPDALIVVVGPIWQNGSPPASTMALRDHLRHVARAVDALFIDPLAEGWFAGSRHALIGADGIHPTDRGHRFIAMRILDDLARGGD